MEQGTDRLKFNWELRADSRSQLSGNWAMAIIVCILFGLITGAAGAIPFLGLVIAGPMTMGLSKFFINLKRGNGTYLESLFDGFNNFGRSLVAGLLIMLFTFLWSLLLIIPGIIAWISYSQAYFILIDNPGMDGMEAIRCSKELMRGYKWKFFVLNLSFFGWAILCLLTLGIGYFWLIPYIQASYANFYDNIKDNSQFAFQNLG